MSNVTDRAADGQAVVISTGPRRTRGWASPPGVPCCVPDAAGYLRSACKMGAELVDYAVIRTTKTRRSRRLVTLQGGDRVVATAEAAANSAVTKLGFAPGQVVQEIGYDHDVDDELRI